MSKLFDTIRLRVRTWSVFSHLLWATLASTTLLSLVLVLSLQRVADEHPRRYLSRALFDAFSESARDPGQEVTMIGAAPMLLMTPDEAANSRFAEIYRDAANDRDGIAISRLGDYYAAVSVRGSQVAILPQFGRPISTYALFLVGVVVLSVLFAVTAIYLLIRQLTLPFEVLTAGIRKVEEGDLSYQIPLDNTFGEYRTFAKGFNKMVAELQRIHESRRHMLLALPHEILTPLSRLKVRKDMLVDENLRAQISKDISVVEEILSSILAAEKRNSGETSADFIDIEPYAREQIAQVAHPGITITIHNETGRKTAYFDSFLTSVLLKNFVSNAVRYGAGKPIAVTFSAVGEEGRDMRIAVRDQGIGISQEHQRFLMEPFWRADESRGRASGGYGLGLYLCKTIVTGLGGQIDITSTLGEGTEISVVLPNVLCNTLEDI
ncbi:HAMP domain-containing protein [Fertoebacter nigrum]|uniref:histidine kinase n=1 Tax=Fertoeibacter niger TaxID=2656921 RepID=A0A8X8KLL6_9RHOB|nr:HAMP domain-containing sensor histidine kinase [Fertoeibacter niger]NUB45439.1 HAMP domain-containing protein [Fertoeibacter niger]